MLPGVEKAKVDFATQAEGGWSPCRTRDKGVVSFIFCLYPANDLTALGWFAVAVVVWFFKELDGKVPFSQSHWANGAGHLQEKELHQEFSDLMDLPAPAL